MLKEFGTSSNLARRAYTRFVRAGIEEPPPSPFAGALEEMLLGSDKFIARIRRLLDDRPTDQSIPQLKHICSRPSLKEIIRVVGEQFEQDTRLWKPGRRSDDASRSVAAYLARQRFGHPAGKVAEALGYRSTSSITRAIARVESGDQRLQRTVARLEKSLH